MIKLETIQEFMKANNHAFEAGGKFELAFTALIAEVNKELGALKVEQTMKAAVGDFVPTLPSRTVARGFASWQCLGDACPVRKSVEHPFAPTCYTCGELMIQVLPPVASDEELLKAYAKYNRPAGLDPYSWKDAI